MNISMMLFPIDFDRFSAIAVDVSRQKKVWTAKFNSRATLLQSLDGTGVVTKAELDELEQKSCFSHGAPVFRVSLTHFDLENAGFSASNM